MRENFLASLIDVGKYFFATFLKRYLLMSFFSEKVFTNEVLTYRSRVGNYIRRLEETENQLKTVKNKLEKYLG